MVAQARVVAVEVVRSGRNRPRFRQQSGQDWVAGRVWEEDVKDDL